MGNVLAAIEDSNFSGEKLPALKFADGDSKKLRFEQEEKIVKTKEFGDKVLFVVSVDGAQHNWWMATNHPLLRQIRDVVGLRVNGKTVLVKRKGSGQKDTRYTVEKA